MEENEIELGILLCNQLFDEEKDGVTYREARQSCKLLDIIELGRIKDDSDAADDNGDHHDPVGYDELIQILNSFLWSNIDINGGNLHNVCSSICQFSEWIPLQHVMQSRPIV